ncbi:MAG: hypothetical protein MMC23_008593 [Stictis urceolatum]|nr:hypothetical protein [Stictis urceolata]
MDPRTSPRQKSALDASSSSRYYSPDAPNTYESSDNLQRSSPQTLNSYSSALREAEQHALEIPPGRSHQDDFEDFLDDYVAVLEQRVPSHPNLDTQDPGRYPDVSLGRIPGTGSFESAPVREFVTPELALDNDDIFGGFSSLHHLPSLRNTRSTNGGSPLGPLLFGPLPPTGHILDEPFWDDPLAAREENDECNEGRVHHSLYGYLNRYEEDDDDYNEIYYDPEPMEEDDHAYDAAEAYDAVFDDCHAADDFGEGYEYIADNIDADRRRRALVERAGHDFPTLPTSSPLDSSADLERSELSLLEDWNRHLQQRVAANDIAEREVKSYLQDIRSQFRDAEERLRQNSEHPHFAKLMRDPSATMREVRANACRRLERKLESEKRAFEMSGGLGRVIAGVQRGGSAMEVEEQESGGPMPLDELGGRGGVSAKCHKGRTCGGGDVEERDARKPSFHQGNHGKTGAEKQAEAAGPSKECRNGPDCNIFSCKNRSSHFKEQADNASDHSSSESTPSSFGALSINSPFRDSDWTFLDAQDSQRAQAADLNHVASKLERSATRLSLVASRLTRLIPQKRPRHISSILLSPKRKRHKIPRPEATSHGRTTIGTNPISEERIEATYHSINLGLRELLIKRQAQNEALLKAIEERIQQGPRCEEGYEVVEAKFTKLDRGGLWNWTPPLNQLLDQKFVAELPEGKLRRHIRRIEREAEKLRAGSWRKGRRDIVLAG